MARPGISTKKTEKIPPGAEILEPQEKHPQNSPKTYRKYAFFSIFSGYFFGIFGVVGAEFRAGGYFFGIFRVGFISGLCSRSGVLKGKGGGSEAPGGRGAVSIFKIENPRRGVSRSRRGRGAGERVWGALGNWGGGGNFVLGAEMSPKFISGSECCLVGSRCLKSTVLMSEAQMQLKHCNPARPLQELALESRKSLQSRSETKVAIQTAC